ncbi:hypothetical protein TWF718_007144 [Orbilia javanica]|uniref:Uncharacterized protein n=1 Tax=Orbilia javanica TaxID=47235 RepID=A0AAN8NVK6_9PEZI
MDKPSFKKSEAPVPGIVTKPFSPIGSMANTAVPSPNQHVSRSQTLTSIQPQSSQMHKDANIKVSKPFTHTQIKNMQEGIIQNFCDRVNALEAAVGAKTAEAEKLRMQIGEITDLAKRAQTSLENAVGQNKIVQESLSQLEEILQKIGKLEVTPSAKVVASAQPPVESVPISQTEAKIDLERPPAPVVIRTERSYITQTPAEEVPTHQSTLSEDVVDLFDFHANDRDIVKDSPKTKTPAAQPSGLKLGKSIIYYALAVHTKTVQAAYADQSREKTQLPHKPGSNQTAIPIKPVTSANQTVVPTSPVNTSRRLAPPPPRQPPENAAIAPFQKLASVMKQSLQGPITFPCENNAIPQQAGLRASPTSAKGLDLAAASGVSSTGPATHTVRFTTLPPNFHHSGNFPGLQNLFYEEGQLCDRKSYTSESVPVLRLQNIPKTMSIGDVLENLSGGPLYRISTTKGDPNDTFKHIRITFIHLHHANAFLEFAQKNHGIYIKGCPNRIQVIQDHRERPNVISYTTFRKMMTENVTRMVYIDGFREGFWTTRKLRDLIVVAVDKLRVEDPDRYQFKEPICDKTDIITAMMGSSKERGIEGLVGLRSIGWAILVRTALHGLQHPEGFYKERVEGELGPTINPGDDIAQIPTLRAFWVPDTVDQPLEKMAKQTSHKT